MPPNLIHCFNCRTLLNTDLDSDSVEIPKFTPLQEIAAMEDVIPAGYFVVCPHCREELRIARKYLGQWVACKHCRGQFHFETESGGSQTRAFFAKCPGCDEELRASPKYLGQKVVCKHCGGNLRFVEP